MFKVNKLNGEYFEVAGGVSGVLGKAGHKALQVFFGGHPDIPTSAVYSEAVKEGYEYGLEYIKYTVDAFIEYSKTIPTREKLIEKYSYCYFGLMKEAHYDKIPQVLLVERKLKHTVEVNGKLLPIPLVGVLDLVYRDKEGRVIIKDHKITYKFSDPDKIDGKKLIQAIFYYFLVYAELGEAPYAIEFDEFKYSENKDKKEPQLKPYRMVYEDISLAFELFYRFYDDVTDALLGKMVYVPNFDAMFDNEVAIISYINYLDVQEKRDDQFRKMKVDNIADFVKKKIQKSGSMKKYLETVEKKFISGAALNYKDMQIQDKIKMKLAEHGIALDFDSKVQGSTVTLYCYEPSIGLKMTRIEAFVKDIEQVVEKTGVRILAPIPNTGLVGFEVPNIHRNYPMAPKVDSKNPFAVAIGETIMGEVRRFDLRLAPHLLVAGTTGSGKSVFLGNTIKHLLTVPNVKLYLFDPKQVELAEYEGHTKVVKYASEPSEIMLTLAQIISEMENRYTIMKEDKIKSIAGTRKFPYLFVIIDEYADLAMSAEVSNLIKKIAQKGRAAGIHLIIATQRASAKIIDGDIKVNFPARMVFKMDKEVSSRIMLDEAGAEKLLGKGDALFLGDNGVERLQAYSE